VQVWAAKAEAFANTDDFSYAQMVVLLFSHSAFSERKNYAAFSETVSLLAGSGYNSGCNGGKTGGL